jgi:hypothetical protein
VLNEYFTLTENGWVNVRALSEIEAYKDKLHKATLAGKASGVARKNKAKQGLKPHEQTFNGCSTDDELNIKQELINIKQETLNKKPIAKKAEAFILPDWINKEHWDLWHQIPKRKKLTNAQKQLAVKQLEDWKLNGIDYELALKNSAMNGWQGLFEPKQSKLKIQPIQSNNKATTEAAKKRLFGDINEKDITYEASRI